MSTRRLLNISNLPPLTEDVTIVVVIPKGSEDTAQVAVDFPDSVLGVELDTYPLSGEDIARGAIQSYKTQKLEPAPIETDFGF